MEFLTVNAEKARCLFFADQQTGDPPSGQQVSCWLPVGTYVVVGPETIAVSDRGAVSDVAAIRLERKNDVFYVAPAVYEEQTQC